MHVGLMGAEFAGFQKSGSAVVEGGGKEIRIGGGNGPEMGRFSSNDSSGKRGRVIYLGLRDMLL